MSAAKPLPHLFLGELSLALAEIASKGFLSCQHMGGQCLLMGFRTALLHAAFEDK
jgi:hypothetical protein